MKRFLRIIIAIIFLASCGKSKPEGIFDEKKMTDLLFDLHLADGISTTYYSESSDKEAINYYSSVYEKYNTDSAGVNENLAYYSALPQTLQDIYAEVSKRLQRTEDELRKIEMEKQRIVFVADSIASKKSTDSLKLIKRDSLIHFNGKYDLFLSDTLKSDTLKKRTSKIDSLKLSGELRPSLRKSVMNEQKRWEMTFYYFEKSNLLPLIKSGTDKETAGADENKP